MNSARFLSTRLGALALGAACGLPIPASALPMGSQDSWMVMGERYPDSYELSANYALTRNDALGVAYGSWEESARAGATGPQILKRDYTALTYTRLLHRWNLPHAQANLWFAGMLGSVRPSERPDSDTLGALSLLADYETTRIYTGAGLEVMRASSIRHDTAYARAGFSFYEVEYEDTQPWLVVEVKRERFSEVSKNSVTPMLRFINRRYFVEVGANRDGAVFSFMLNF